MDTASMLLAVEAHDRGETSRFEILLDEQDISRRCHLIRAVEIDTLICGAISRPFLRMLVSAGIDVIQNISGHAEDVLKAYLNGNLFNSRFLMPGCDGRRLGQGSKPVSPKRPHRQRNNDMAEQA